MRKRPNRKTVLFPHGMRGFAASNGVKFILEQRIGGNSERQWNPRERFEPRAAVQIKAPRTFEIVLQRRAG